MICMMCSVRKECEDYKQKTGSTDGIWAGQYNSEKKARSNGGE